MSAALLNPASRVLIALIFLVSGVGKIFAFQQTAALMSSVGFSIPELFLVGAVAIELSGGIGLVFGYMTRYSAAALIVFVLAATLMFHLRSVLDPTIGQEQIAHTLKNLAIIGGLLKFVTDGGGNYSLDRRFEREEILV